MMYTKQFPLSLLSKSFAMIQMLTSSPMINHRATELWQIRHNRNCVLMRRVQIMNFHVVIP